MREIVSPLDGIRSPFGFIRGGGVVPIPANAIRQRDSAYILDRAGSYIEVRA